METVDFEFKKYKFKTLEKVNYPDENSEKSTSRKSYLIDEANPFFKDLSSTLDNVCLTDIESDSDNDSINLSEASETQKFSENSEKIKSEEEIPSIVSFTEEISSAELQRVKKL